MIRTVKASTTAEPVVFYLKFLLETPILMVTPIFWATRK